MSSEEEEERYGSLPVEDDDQMEVTEENIRKVIENNGGKIANKALVKQFKKALSSSGENRTKFRHIINGIAVIEKDAKGRDIISLKKKIVVAAAADDHKNEPEVLQRPENLPTTSKEKEEKEDSSSKEEEKTTPDSKEEESSPVAEVDVALGSPSGEKVRERAKMFEIKEKENQERESPSRILRSATDVEAVVCASGHAEDDNNLSLDDVKRKWMIAAAESDYQTMCRILQDHCHLAGWRNFCNGYTALHYAAKFGQDDCIKLLGGVYKANINAINHAGMTPLHMAAMHNRGRSIQLLVETYKADPNIRDYRGKLPKDYLSEITRRISLPDGYDYTLNTSMVLDVEERLSDTMLKYLDGTRGGTMRFDTGTIDGAAGGTLKSSDQFANSNILRRSFRVGTTRSPTATLPPDQRQFDTLSPQTQMKGTYASHVSDSMKRVGSPNVSRTMSMPKGRLTAKKHIKNQKKFASMIEESIEENES